MYIVLGFGNVVIEYARKILRHLVYTKLRQQLNNYFQPRILCLRLFYCDEVLRDFFSKNGNIFYI